MKVLKREKRRGEEKNEEMGKVTRACEQSSGTE